MSRAGGRPVRSLRRYGRRTGWRSGEWLAIQAIARRLTGDESGEGSTSSPFHPHTTSSGCRSSVERVHLRPGAEGSASGRDGNNCGQRVDPRTDCWRRSRRDSRAYLWHNERLEPLTRDHSLMEAHIEAGLADEGKAPGRAAKPARACAGSRACCRSRRDRSAGAIGRLRAAVRSDGLTRMVSEEELAKAIQTFQERSRSAITIATANQNGARTTSRSWSWK